MAPNAYTVHPLVLIQAALHYSDTNSPFYEISQRGQPARGIGDSKYQATLTLKSAGLLVERQEGNVCYYGTDGLRVYVESLRKVPLPVIQWGAPK